MRIHLGWVAFWAIVSAVFFVQPSHAAAPSLAAKLDRYMQARTSLGHFSGSVLVASNGVVLLSKGYGPASRSFAAVNRPDTRFLVASITKQFTAAAVLKLRDSGKLSLDDPLCRWIDRCPASWTKITLRHLLAHRSGIWDYEAGLELGSSDYAAEMVRPDHIARLIDRARKEPLANEPGKAFNYSNTGYLFLAQVIKKASGESFKRYVEDNILKPAGMLSSGIVDGSPVPNLANGYRLGDDLSRAVLLKGSPAETIPLNEQSAGNLAGDHGDAALFATAPDLYRWLLALEAGQVLKPASVAELRSPSGPEYGLGVAIEKRFEETVYVHNGVLPGFVSRIEWNPRNKIAVIVLSNIENSRFTKIAQDLAAIVMGRPYDIPQSHTVASLTEAQMRKFEGNYRLGDLAVTISQKDGMLVVAGPSFTAGMVPLEGGKFYLPLFEGVLSFPAASEPQSRDGVFHFDGTDHPFVAQGQAKAADSAPRRRPSF